MKTIAVVLAALGWAIAGGSQARAQSADDWDLVDGATPGLTMASVAFSGGSAIAVRCRAGTLDVLVAGLPASTSLSRHVEMTMPGVVAEDATWLAQPGGGLLSPSEPDRIARMLRAGGHIDLRLLADAENATGVRLALDYPASPAAIDRVLTDCNVPLSEAHDTIRRVGSSVQWEQRPAPEFPERALEQDIKRAEVRLGCLVNANGRLTDCWLLAETPPDVGFGRSAVKAAEDSRMSPPQGEGPWVSIFTVHFRIAD